MRHSAWLRCFALSTPAALAPLGARATSWRAVPTEHYDVCVIGGGPGGIAAAVHSVDYGKKVCLIEQYRVGGADLWNGTLMSKMMWERGDILSKMNGHNARRVFGRTLTDYVALNTTQMCADVERVSHTRATQLLAALNATRVDLFYGRASFTSNHEVQLRNKESHEYRTIRADYFVIATGSTPRQHPFAAIDGTRVVTSDHIMQMSALPRRMVIVGAGPLGCEFASIYARLGQTQVYLIDKASHVLPTEDNDVVQMVEKHMEQSGVVIHHDSVLYDMQVFDSGTSCSRDGTNAGAQQSTAESGAQIRGCACLGNDASKQAHALRTSNNNKTSRRRSMHACDGDNNSHRSYSNATTGRTDNDKDNHSTHRPGSSSSSSSSSSSDKNDKNNKKPFSLCGGGVRYTVMHRATQELRSFEVDCALIAVGRQPNYASLGLENTTLQVVDGVVVVNAFCQSITCPHVYVIGDAVSSAQLVSVAESQGRDVMDHIYGTTLHRGCCSTDMITYHSNTMLNAHAMANAYGGTCNSHSRSHTSSHSDSGRIGGGGSNNGMLCNANTMRHRHRMTDLPQSRAAVIFVSHPVASVGFNEKDCQARHIAYLAASIGYEAVSRTIAADRTDGLLKIIVSDDGARQLLGVRAIGMHASTLVNLGALAIEHHYTVDDMARMLTAYPAVSQAFQECLRAICATPSSTVSASHSAKGRNSHSSDSNSRNQGIDATVDKDFAEKDRAHRSGDAANINGSNTCRTGTSSDAHGSESTTLDTQSPASMDSAGTASEACASGTTTVVTTEAVGAAVAGVQMTRWSPPCYERGAVYQGAQIEACKQKKQAHKPKS